MLPFFRSVDAWYGWFRSVMWRLWERWYKRSECIVGSRGWCQLQKCEKWDSNQSSWYKHGYTKKETDAKKQYKGTTPLKIAIRNGSCSTASTTRHEINSIASEDVCWIAKSQKWKIGKHQNYTYMCQVVPFLITQVNLLPIHIINNLFVVGPSPSAPSFPITQAKGFEEMNQIRGFNEKFAPNYMYMYHYNSHSLFCIPCRH